VLVEELGVLAGADAGALAAGAALSLDFLLSAAAGSDEVSFLSVELDSAVAELFGA
jgi:hypothetical protein